MDIVQFLKDGLAFYGALKTLTGGYQWLHDKSMLPKVHKFSCLHDLSNAYFEKQISDGDIIELHARLSGFGFVVNPWVGLADLGYWSAHMHPPCGKIPSISTKVSRVDCFFLYPVNCNGLNPTVTSSRTSKTRETTTVSYPQCIPLLAPVQSPTRDYLENVCRIRARICPLPEEFIKILIVPELARIGEFYSLFYRPLSLVRKGFCLSMCDYDGDYNSQCDIGLSLDINRIPPNFVLPVFIQFHYSKLYFPESNFPRHDSIKIMKFEGIKDFENLKVSAAAKIVFEPLLGSSAWKMKDSYIVDLGGIVYNCMFKDGLAIFKPPGSFGIKINIDIQKGYEEGIERLIRLFSDMTQGFKEQITKDTGQIIKPELNFLSDYHLQYVLNADGVLTSPEAQEAISGQKELDQTLSWLRLEKFHRQHFNKEIPMFEELIVQGKDMIRRLEAHIGLSYEERKKLPVIQQVAIKEAEAWQNAVQERIQTTFSADALARYNVFRELNKCEVKLGEGVDVARALNLWRRIIAFLGELQERLDCRSTIRISGGVTMISILFLAADPTDASRLRLGEEFREIQEKLKLSKLRDHFELKLPQLSVRAADISQALLDTQPQIVHFSGHGTPTGALCFENRSGATHLVQSDALAALFEQFSNQVNCVLLNACYSEMQARAIAEHIEHVIGMNQAIGDKAAISFAIGFYQALGAGRTIEEAYKLGCVQIRLQSISEHLTPVLIKKGQSQ